MTALVALAWALATVAQGAPRIAVEPAEFDFGRARQEQTLHREFRISNHGDAPLTIGRITSSCGCSAWRLDDEEIAPGSSTTLRVRLDTRDDRGRVERVVLIASNDPRRPQTTIRLYVTIVTDE